MKQKDRRFIKIDLGVVLEVPITIYLRNLLTYFSDNVEEINIDIIFADPLGKFFHRTLHISDFKINQETDTKN